MREPILLALVVVPLAIFVQLARAIPCLAPALLVSTRRVAIRPAVVVWRAIMVWAGVPLRLVRDLVRLVIIVLLVPVLPPKICALLLLIL